MALNLKDKYSLLAKFKILVMFTLIFTFSYIGNGQAKINKKYASIVVDAQTGTVLSASNANKKLHPASLTKMMTLYMAFDALKKGTLRKNQRIKISKYAASMVPSKLGLKPGQTITVNDAILSLVTKSANDVAVALGEKIGGTEYRFAQMMTKKARQLGMKNTTFKNASGLHHVRQVSTARDMAVLSRSLIYNHRQHYHYFKIKQFHYRGKTYKNHNKLLHSYKGMDGLKTGYVNASGFNLAASAVQNNRRIVGVVFGGKTSKARNSHMASILDRGFLRLKRTRIAKQEKPNKKPVVTGGYTMVTNTKAPNIKKIDKEGSFKKIGIVNDNEVTARVVGQGDVDVEATKTLNDLLRETANFEAVKPNTLNAQYQQKILKAKAVSGIRNSPIGEWSIQIGAFKDRALTKRALMSAAGKLPYGFVRSSTPKILPVKTRSGVIYRGRFTGVDRKGANQACRVLDNCVVIASN